MMKKLMFSIVLGVASIATITRADTNNPAGLQTFLDSATSASNYTAVVYASHFDSNNKFGGGVMLLYNIGDYVSAGLGSDYAGEWRMFSGTVNVHKTWNLNSKLSLDTYGIVAAGTSVGGAGTSNGSLATGEGGGAHFNYRINDKWSAGLGGGYIQRQGCGEFSGGSEIVTVSVGFKF